MLPKLIILFTMLMILIALGSALVSLVRDEGKTKRSVKALTWRIALSLTLFLFLLLAFSLNWIQPHAI